MSKKGLIRGLFLVVGIVLAIGVFSFFGSAENYTLTEVNSTYSTVWVLNTTNMYSYEVNLNYSGILGDISVYQSNFLGNEPDATYGYELKDGILSVYGSRLDSDLVGVNGSGELFNVSNVDGENISLDNVLVIGSDAVQTIFNFTAENVTSDLTSECENASYTCRIACLGGETTSSESCLLEGDICCKAASDTIVTRSGGGGGGGSLANVVSNIKINPTEINLNLEVGRTESVKVNLANEGDSKVSLIATFIGLGDSVNITREIDLLPGENKDVVATFKGTEKGVVIGKILFYDKENMFKSIGEVPVVINVKSGNFLFDVLLNVLPQYKIVSSGNNVIARLKLIPVGGLDKVNAVAEYTLKDASGNEYWKSKDNLVISGTSTFEKVIPTSGLVKGSYIVGVKVSYGNEFATASDSFKVGNRFRGVWVIVGVAVLLSAIVIASWHLMGRKHRHKVKYKK